jgi:hypothetical protein
MQKFVLMILLTIPVVSSLFSREPSPPVFVKKFAVSDFNRLIIKSDITVMLIEDATEDSLRVEGNKKFIEKIIVIATGRELIVRSKSIRDQKKDGVVYIPVHSLKDMEINADAKVISYNTLLSPELNILINGNCTIDLMLKGKLNIREASGYDYTYRRVYENKQTPFVQN